MRRALPFYLSACFWITTALLGLSSCGGQPGSHELKENFLAHQSDYVEVANLFAKQNSIKRMTIFSAYDNKACDYINHWQYCGDGWMYLNPDSPNGKPLKAATINDVLRHENIKRADYDYYYQFLQKHQLSEIRFVQEVETLKNGGNRENACENCVEFSYRNNVGVRHSPQYYKAADDMYVKRMEDGWYLFQKNSSVTAPNKDLIQQ